MKVVLLTDAPYCRDVRAQRTLSALFDLDVSLTVFDQGFDIETSRGMLPEGVKHFSSPIPSNKIGRFVWHVKNNLLPHVSLRTTNQLAYDVLCKSTPDAIHLVNPFLGDAVMRYLGEHAECKLVYEAYEYWPEYLFDKKFGVHKALRNHLEFIETQLLEKSSLFIAVSEPIVGFYREKASIQKSAVIYNANVPDGQDNGEILAERSVRLSSPMKMIFSGQFVRDRHVDKFLKALAKIDKPYSLLLLGSGPEEDLYRKIISDNRLENKVSIAAPVSPAVLIERLKDFDIGVNFGSAMTRQQNGAAPNKIFDYLRAGLAIISSETDGIKSLSIDECIEYVPCDDEKALVFVLDNLLKNKERVLSMKKNSQTRANEFSPKVEIEKLSKLYQSLGL